MNKESWKVSLHGGHSGQFCDHAVGTLRQVIEAGIAFGYTTFGISEHCPRYEERFLYPKELELGWDLDRLLKNFEDYKIEVAKLAEEYKNQIEILVGFEAEIIPAASYVERMKDIREQGNFDFVIGSVHYVKEKLIDYSNDDFVALMNECGGLELLVLEYYENILEMIGAIKPEVVGHLDMISKFGKLHGDLASTKIQAVVQRILEEMKLNNILIDLNARPIFRGEKDPYIAPWIMDKAQSLGVGVCFGDDSHGPEQVGYGIPRCREYLKNFGFKYVTCLTKSRGSLEQIRVEI